LIIIVIILKLNVVKLILNKNIIIHFKWNNNLYLKNWFKINKSKRRKNNNNKWNKIIKWFKIKKKIKRYFNELIQQEKKIIKFVAIKTIDY
jgi:hypothetical protein